MGVREDVRGCLAAAWLLLCCAAWLCCLAAAAWRLTLRRFKLSHICCCNRCHLPPGETLLTMCTRTASKMACANVCSGTEIASSSTVRAGYLCVQQEEGMVREWDGGAAAAVLLQRLLMRTSSA